MTASHDDRVWARTQPLILMEGYLFRATEYGTDAAGDWLHWQHVKDAL